MFNLFDNIFLGESQSTIDAWKFLLCIGVSIAMGLIYMAAYSHKSKSTGSFRMTLALLPAVVCVVIMMVNGNIGVGVAIAGAFSLVRFRSAQGTAREICVIFMTMCSGLIAGVGYLAYAVLFTLIMAAGLIIYNNIASARESGSRERVLKLTVPEDLDYSGAFDVVFDTFTESHSLVHVKTANMGSLFKLTYDIKFKESANEKEFIDKLRVRNGNLEISVSKKEENENEL